ncbi:hypothetical protein GCM10028801_42470 [Nocardioides maradonensis]
MALARTRGTFRLLRHKLGNCGTVAILVVISVSALTVPAVTVAAASTSTSKAETYAVPSGYWLREGFGKRTRYTYESGWDFVTTENCDDAGICTYYGIQARIREQLFGGDSTRWKLTVQTKRQYDGSNGINPINGWVYVTLDCGMRIPKAPHRLCSYQDASAMGRGTTRLYVGYVSGTSMTSTSFNRSFGWKHPRLTKFPLLKVDVVFDCGGGGMPCRSRYAKPMKFRGWDIWKGKYHGKEWHLAPATGAGPT